AHPSHPDASPPRRLLRPFPLRPAVHRNRRITARVAPRAVRLEAAPRFLFVPNVEPYLVQPGGLGYVARQVLRAQFNSAELLRVDLRENLVGRAAAHGPRQESTRLTPLVGSASRQPRCATE